MKEAYRLTRKDGAPGIDGVTADEYATNLEANLLDLLDRIKSGRYKAPPVRRTYIPKATSGSQKAGLLGQFRRPPDRLSTESWRGLRHRTDLCASSKDRVCLDHRFTHPYEPVA